MNQNYRKEGETAKALEQQTSKVPSDVYLAAALATMGISLGLFIANKMKASVFFGQWAPSLLIIGLYNKIVKVEGHDAEDKTGE